MLRYCWIGGNGNATLFLGMKQANNVFIAGFGFSSLDLVYDRT